MGASAGSMMVSSASWNKCESVTNTAQKVFELQLLSCKCYNNMKILNLEDLLQGLSSRYSSHIESRESVEKIVCAVMAIPG